MKAAAQDSQTTVPTPQPGVIRLGNGVTAPRLLFKREPMYSEEARIAGLEGRIRLSIMAARRASWHLVLEPSSNAAIRLYSSNKPRAGSTYAGDAAGFSV
jgi:hypothetical protein